MTTSFTMPRALGVMAIATTTALVALPAAVHAASVTTNLSYAKNDTSLDGSGSFGFNESTRLNIGIGTLDFGARASAGDVDAKANIGFTTSYGDVVDLASASNFEVSHSLNSLSFEYDTFVGATAGAGIDFASFAGINIPRIGLVDEGYSLETEDSRSGFGSTGNDVDTERLTGVGPNVSLGLGVRAEVTLNAAQTSSFEVDDLFGGVLAVHESGVTASDTFSLQGDMLSNLDLSLAGVWTLSLVDLDLANMFDTSLGLAAGYEAGLAFGEVGGGCGDYSTDDDNENSLIPLRACVSDTGVSGTSSQLTLINPRAFEIQWGTKTASLGTVTVVAPPVSAVPLPAGAPLILTGLAGLAWLRRRKTA